MISLLVTLALWAWVEWVYRTPGGAPSDVHRTLLRWHRVVLGTIAGFTLARLGLRSAFRADLLDPSWIPPVRRAVGAIVGLFLAAWGNYLPTLPSPWARADEPFDYQRVHRFVGWTATLTGVAIAVVWSVASLERAPEITRALMLGWAALALGRKAYSLATHQPGRHTPTSR